MKNNEERQVEWWETLDSVLGKLKELKEENEQLKEENEKLKAIKPCTCKAKRETQNGAC